MSLFPQVSCALGPEKVCALYTSRHEHLKGIPRHLLASISKVESGRYDKSSQEVIAWPWTINAEGKGFRYQTKQEAIKAVRALQKKGIRSIDVGCMQVNLHHHEKAFRTLEEAFDPRKNTAYAAQFLLDLKEAHKSWTKAVAHYHSATPKHHRPYRKKVYDTWRAERQNDHTLHKEEKMSHWVSLRDRARASHRFKKKSDTIASLSHIRYPRHSRVRQRQNSHPLSHYRARAQNSLIQKKHQKERRHDGAKRPLVLAGGPMPSRSPLAQGETQRSSFSPDKYASLRKRARKLLDHAR